MVPQSQGAPRPGQVAAFFEKHRTGLVTLVFTDLVDSSALLQKLGDQAGATFLKQRREIIRDKLRAIPEGEEIETAGDSFLLVSSKPSDAVRFALLVQAQLRSFSEASGLSVQERIGIHLGEVVIDEGETEGKAKDLYGIQLTTASRVMSLAQGGQILLTRGVFDSARQVLKGEDILGIGQLSWVSHGPYLLKGVEEPIEVCEVGEQGQREFQAPQTSEKAQRQVRPDEEPVLGWRPAVAQIIPGTAWLLEEKLGEGGFGEVWLAENPRLNEKHVFKFCFRADRIRALKREVTLFRLLKEHVGEHPHVVRLHNVYFDEPPYFIEEEYVSGRDLATWCRDRGNMDTIPLARRLEIVAQAAEALQAAHDSGIIHRDIKPGNLLVSVARGAEEDISVKLTDFGIGQVTTSSALSGVTRSGFTQTMVGGGASSKTGTQLYMAPELIAGQPASTRSDIYSLGVVLYQLLSGDLSRPVTTDWARHVHDPLLREDLEQCFAGDPDERFAGASQLAANIRNLPERRQRREEELRQARRHRVAAVSSVVAAVFILLAGALAYGMWKARKAQDLAEAYTYAADMNLAQEAFLADDLGKARRLLDRYQPATGRGHLRGFEWCYLSAMARDDFAAIDLSTADAPIRITLSPDAKTLAVARFGGAIELWDPTTLKRTATLETNAGGGHSVCFSPKGDLLATPRFQGGLRLWQLDPRRLVGELPHNSSALCLSFSPDGKHLAAFLFSAGALVWELENLQVVRKYTDLRPQGVHGGEVSFSPDGRYLALGDRSGRIRIVDWTADRVVAEFRAHDQPIMSLAWSPDGSLLASGSGYSADDIRLWAPATGEVVGSLSGHRGWISDLGFSQDGRQLISASADQTIGVWDVVTRSQTRRLRGHQDEVWSLAFDDLRSNLFSGAKDGTLARWNIEQARQEAPRYELPEEVRSPTFSGSEDDVVGLDAQGAVALWRPDDQKRLSVLADLGANNTTLTVAPARGLVACAPRGGPIRILSLQSDNLVTNLVEHRGRIDDLLFSDAGDMLLARGRSGSFTFWDTEGWHMRRFGNETNGPVVAAALSPDTRLLVLSSIGGRLFWWDTVAGERLAETTGHRHRVAGLDFSPTQNILASVSEDGTVALWDTLTRRRTAHWKGFLRGLHGVAFSPDGKRLAIGLGGGYVVRLWDVRTRRELVTLRAPGLLFSRLSFHPEGDALLCSSSTGSYLWRVPALAELDAGRRLEDHEH